MNVTATPLDAVELGLFASRLAAICDEMGARLRHAAFSPNIRDRIDFSCAIFDAEGALCAQAAHIPVHLGSMAHAMRGIVARMSWRPGDQVILNDPFLGGTHLPDVTLVAPLFLDGECVAFVANRAHHADIGAATPGSMPVSSTLEEEGLVIEPVHLEREGRREASVWNWILAATGDRQVVEGDLSAQLAANRAGIRRLEPLVKGWGLDGFRRALAALNDYAERLALDALRQIPDGCYRFADWLDDDGQGQYDIPIQATVILREGRVTVDFSGTAAQVSGNVNCPLSVAAAAVHYVFRCLMPPQMPACDGAFRPVTLKAPEGCLLNARSPAAVAAGNVETSTRVVDVVMGALAQAIPERMAAASHGSMNNLAMGSTGPRGPSEKAIPGFPRLDTPKHGFRVSPPNRRPASSIRGQAMEGLQKALNVSALPQRWDYYETLGGGMGAGAGAPGRSGVQTHMTNTLNTPVEVLERQYPVRIERYALRRGSGGAGRWRGGDGLVRSYRFLAPAEFTLLTERRRHAPWGLAGGCAGAPGSNRLDGRLLPPKCHRRVQAGACLTIETPGGGGYGTPDAPCGPDPEEAPQCVGSVES